MHATYLAHCVQKKVSTEKMSRFHNLVFYHGPCKCWKLFLMCWQGMATKGKPNKFFSQNISQLNCSNAEDLVKKKVIIIFLSNLSVQSKRKSQPHLICMQVLLYICPLPPNPLNRHYNLQKSLPWALLLTAHFTTSLLICLLL